MKRDGVCGVLFGMMRSMPKFLLGVVVLAIAGLIGGCGKSVPPPAFHLPTADQVKEMRASIPAVKGFGDGPIPEFVVPPEQVANILFWLSPGERTNEVTSGVDRGIYFHVADIIIHTKDGKELRLRCHDWGCNPVAFTPNGKDYYLGHGGDEKGEHGQAGIDGGAMLYNAIKKAHKARKIDSTE